MTLLLLSMTICFFIKLWIYKKIIIIFAKWYLSSELHNQSYAFFMHRCVEIRGWTSEWSESNAVERKGTQRQRIIDHKRKYWALSCIEFTAHWTLATINFDISWCRNDKNLINLREGENRLKEYWLRKKMDRYSM